MTVCTTKNIEHSRCKRRKIQAEFNGGEIAIDGGVMLLSEIDRRLQLSTHIIDILNGPLCKSKIKHSSMHMLWQTLSGLAFG